MSSSVTVGGETPEILVEYVGNAAIGDNTAKAVLFTTDNGEPRSIARGGQAYVTLKELGLLQRGREIRVITTPVSVKVETVIRPVAAPAPATPVLNQSA